MSETATIDISKNIYNIIEPPPMIATEEQLDENRVPWAYRDYCSHLLIDLNKCRRSNFYMPFKCEHERHTYEMCEYKE